MKRNSKSVATKPQTDYRLALPPHGDAVASADDNSSNNRDEPMVPEAAALFIGPVGQKRKGRDRTFFNSTTDYG